MGFGLEICYLNYRCFHKSLCDILLDNYLAIMVISCIWCCLFFFFISASIDIVKYGELILPISVVSGTSHAHEVFGM